MFYHSLRLNFLYNAGTSNDSYVGIINWINNIATSAHRLNLIRQVFQSLYSWLNSSGYAA